MRQFGGLKDCCECDPIDPETCCDEEAKPSEGRPLVPETKGWFGRYFDKIKKATGGTPPKCH